MWEDMGGWGYVSEGVPLSILMYKSNLTAAMKFLVMAHFLIVKYISINVEYTGHSQGTGHDRRT